MANLDQISHAFEHDIEMLNNTMIPHLNQTITGLNNSNRTVQALQSNCQTRLSELETLIQALTPLLTQESNVPQASIAHENNQTMRRQASSFAFF